MLASILAVGAVLVATAATAAQPTLVAGAGAPVSVRTRVYGSEVVSAADGDEALRAATVALSAAGIDISWVRCQPSPRPGDACSVPLAPGELAVHLLGAAPPSSGNPNRRSLGHALVTAEPGTSQMATVYVDRVVWLADRARASRATLLGRAVAHEVGHLLLGTNGHARAGLMRASWSDMEVRNDAPGDWQFDRAGVDAIQATLHLRQAGWQSVPGSVGCGTD